MKIRHAMNIRQVRFGVDLFTGLVVASVGVALAGLTWRLAGASGAAPVASTAPATTVDPVDIAGLLALAPFGTAQAASDAASDGSLHLKGILLAVPASASVALIAGSDGKVTSYGIGAALGGGVVEAIEASQVILRTPRGLQTVGFSPAANAPSLATPGAGIAAAGFVPVGSAPATASVTVPVPSAGTAGSPAQGGFRVSSSAPAALLAAGLQPGDIVEEVNGKPVTAGVSADMVARNLALHGGIAQVIVVRNGNRVSLNVAIH